MRRVQLFLRRIFKRAQVRRDAVEGLADVHALINQVAPGDEPREAGGQTAVRLARSLGGGFGEIAKIGGGGGDGQVPGVV